MRKRIIQLFTIITLLAVPFGYAPTPVSAGGAPESATISGFKGHKQAHNLSCEARSAVDLAGYYGVKISENAFLSKLPKSSNPNKGFVGSANGTWGSIPPNSYGVHAGPVAKLLRKYGLKAKAVSGASAGDIKQAISSGKPVIVWVIGAMWPGTAKKVKFSDGSSATVAKYEHTMIITGYSSGYIKIFDPSAGASQTYTWSSFKSSWSVLGNSAVFIDKGKGKSSKPAANSTKKATKTYTVRPGDTLSSIAKKYGVTVTKIANLNNIGAPWVIHVGQKLRIK